MQQQKEKEKEKKPKKGEDTPQQYYLLHSVYSKRQCGGVSFPVYKDEHRICILGSLGIVWASIMCYTTVKIFFLLGRVNHIGHMGPIIARI